MGRGLSRALREFRTARRLRAHVRQPHAGAGRAPSGETPYLPLGGAADGAVLSSYCVAVPREHPSWDESYGGEDGVFSATPRPQATARLRPAFHANTTTAARLGRPAPQQQRMATGSRASAAWSTRAPSGESRRRASHTSRSCAPGHLPPVGTEPELKHRFVRYLPRLVVAEWTLGASATRYALFPPPTQGQSGDGFR